MPKRGNHDRGTPGAGASRRVALLALVLVGGGVAAEPVTGTPSGFQPSGSSSFQRFMNATIPQSARTVTFDAAGRAVIADASTLAGRAGPMQVLSNATLSRAAVGRVLAAGLTGLGWGIPIAVAGGAMVAWWKANHVGPDGEGGLIKDPRANTITKTERRWVCGSNPGQGSGTTAQEACLAWIANKNAASQWINTSGVACRSKTTWRFERMHSATMVAYRTDEDRELNSGWGGTCTDSIGTSDAFEYAYDMGNTTSVVCPASIDPFNPEYSIAEGSPPGPDGKCETARGNWQPITVPQAGEIFQGAATPLPEEAGEQVKTGLQSWPTEEPEERTSQGPASQTGEPKTTTTTDQNGTTTKVETPRYEYTYHGDRIDVKTTVTTNTCVGAGACSPETATETETTEPEKPEQEKFCEANPSALMCIELGDPPQDQVPKADRTVTFQAESLGLGGSCPAPVQLPHGQSIGYQTLCDGLTQARPLIIAIGFLMAAGIMVGGFKLE